MKKFEQAKGSNETESEMSEDEVKKNVLWSFEQLQDYLLSTVNKLSFLKTNSHHRKKLKINIGLKTF